MAKPNGCASLGPFLYPQIIKDELKEICGKEIDPDTGKKKTMETKVLELVVKEIKIHKPEFETPQTAVTNGGNEHVIRQT